MTMFIFMGNLHQVFLIPETAIHPTSFTIQLIVNIIIISGSIPRVYHQ